MFKIGSLLQKGGVDCPPETCSTGKLQNKKTEVQNRDNKTAMNGEKDA